MKYTDVRVVFRLPKTTEDDIAPAAAVNDLPNGLLVVVFDKILLPNGLGGISDILGLTTIGLAVDTVNGFIGTVVLTSVKGLIVVAVVVFVDPVADAKILSGF